jgi:ribosomal protein S18 acetylase RimI-like enzyme
LKFEIYTGNEENVTDEEISGLLGQVYVDAGYTSAETAKVAFKPASVRNRGKLISAREESTMDFAGMVIVVPPDSPARVRANFNECEIHLLGVKPAYRGHGLGRSLVNAAINTAQQDGWSKIILWTQKSMSEAQRLYESAGFTQTGEMQNNAKGYFVYEKKCI